MSEDKISSAIYLGEIGCVGKNSLKGKGDFLP
jgi:hypothetical protein